MNRRNDGLLDDIDEDSAVPPVGLIVSVLLLEAAVVVAVLLL